MLSQVNIYELAVEAPPMVSYMLVHAHPKEDSLKGIQMLQEMLPEFLRGVDWSYSSHSSQTLAVGLRKNLIQE